VVEALACGLPVLISNRVNIWREIEQDGAGLVANDDAPGCTQLLQGWTSLSAQQRSTMASVTTACFAQRFAMDAAAARLNDVLVAVTQAVTQKA
jgi:glycosyltransferase involved in cell wall biosynthesis